MKQGSVRGHIHVIGRGSHSSLPKKELKPMREVSGLRLWVADERIQKLYPPEIGREPTLPPDPFQPCKGSIYFFWHTTE